MITGLITIVLALALLSDVLLNQSKACTALWESIKLGWNKLFNGGKS